MMQHQPGSQRPAAAPQAEGTAHPAFHDLLVAALPTLRQQAYALTRNRADADDLLQAAVTNALAARDSFTPGTNFNGWMSCILRNRFLSDCRRRRETVAVEDAPADAFAGPASQEDSLALGELRKHLARLPADQREALIMVTIEGLSYEEMSARLGVPVGTLKARVCRGREQLRIWLLGEEPARGKAGSRAAARQDAGATRRRRAITETTPELRI
jgi:RNA polymerase sigma-70 factor, ECF subfamily